MNYGTAHVGVRSKAKSFRRKANRAISNPRLQKALENIEHGFIRKRLAAAQNIGNFEDLRNAATDARNRALKNFAGYLAILETEVTKRGGHVHWATDAKEARSILLGICERAGAKLITKGKSLTTEEIGTNKALESHGYQVLETDLGEYIIQLRKEAPSHIIAPALHVTRQEVEDTFLKSHKSLPSDRNLNSIYALAREVREQLRPQWPRAEIGITGANFLIAETGQGVIVTNEGNGDLTQLAAKVHVAVAGIEKVVATPADCLTLLRVLSRSATGQDISTYTTFFSGPKRENEIDGPNEFHLILVDNGRSQLMGTRHQSLLRCIRCGACMNHCPVYAAVGGHAYGSVYPGPIGAAFNPTLYGLAPVAVLSEATTSCGRCEEVCPVRIPLVRIMREHREQNYRERPAIKVRLFLKWFTSIAMRTESWDQAKLWFNKSSFFIPVANQLRFLPFLSSWTRQRNLPRPGRSQKGGIT